MLTGAQEGDREAAEAQCAPANPGQPLFHGPGTRGRRTR